MKHIAILIGVDFNSNYAITLRNNGYALLLTHHESEVFELWPLPGFDVAVVDECFENWDTVVARLRAERFYGPVVLLSRQVSRTAQKCLKEAALQTGITIYGTDIRPERLTEIINVALGVKAAADFSARYN